LRDDHANFTLSDSEWAPIKRAVGVLGVDADRVPLQRRGPLYNLTLRSEIETAATIHLLRSPIMDNLPTAKALADFLVALRQDAEDLRSKIARSHIFRSDIGSHKADPDMERLSHQFFSKLLHNIDGRIAALGTPRKHKSAKKAGRDLFWEDILSIWREIGGKPTGVDSADFIIAVSKPVFDAMPQHGDTIGSRDAVVAWLLRHTA
jgi:hypothetical protein